MHKGYDCSINKLNNQRGDAMNTIKVVLQSVIIDYRDHTLAIATDGAFNITDISVVYDDISEVLHFSTLEDAIKSIDYSARFTK